MTWEEFELNQEEYNAIKEFIKQRTLIFDVSGKEHTAKFFGLPLETYYHYSFEDWMIAKQRLTDYIEQMSQNIRKVEVFYGEDLSNVSFTNWKSKFETWAKENNIEIVKAHIHE